MKPTLSDIETLARGAGKILRECSGQHLQIKQKGEIDLVTEADHRSEAYLISEIRQRFPTHRIITEESGELAGAQEQVWYIDPLDGTLNYAHGLPIYAVSIAYEENGQVLLGVVYDPERDECFSAERGRGAWLNGARLEGPACPGPGSQPAGHRLPVRYSHQSSQQPGSLCRLCTAFVRGAPPGVSRHRPVLCGRGPC